MKFEPPTVHMVVKNEDRFVYFALKSVLPYVDRILVFDTGSRDDTVNIIKSFKTEKIIFERNEIKNPERIAIIRDDQIKKTKSDWIWIVDGDEIYPKSLCEEIQEEIKNKGDKLEGIVVGRYDLLGDIYHVQSESVGSYNLFGRKGHFAIRLLNRRKISGLHVRGLYPYEGYYDKDNAEVIHHPPAKFQFTQGKLFHAMYLKRSSLGRNLIDTYHRTKYKIELGRKLPEDTEYPQVFFGKKDEAVIDVTNKRSLGYLIVASLVTPVKMMKRKLL